MTNSKNGSVILHTTPTCPDCRAVKQWFATEGVAFEERDLSDPQIAEEAKARTGVRVAPIVIIEGQVFYGTFADQKPRLAEALKLTGTAQG